VLRHIAHKRVLAECRKALGVSSQCRNTPAIWDVRVALKDSDVGESNMSEHANDTVLSSDLVAKGEERMLLS
jgi:hypothetical protein